MRFLYRETDAAKIRLSIDSVFRCHNEAIQFLESWTGIPFPFQKVGFVAIPSFQFGGMEHPGEVQYNASALFLDSGATRDQQISRSTLISHETAHMWFGDLVTMKWFNDVWMKEVFANFMADKVTEKLLGPVTFRLKFLLDHTPAAYNVDRTPGANPIRQQLNNLQDAGSLYGNIIYHKAPIMMRQLERLMGPLSFQQGVREYLRKYKYGNANWDDLIAMLARHTKEDLYAWNKVWVNRPGRPVFNYQYVPGALHITQTPESGPAAVWPQHFDIICFYKDSIQTVAVNSKTTGTIIPMRTKPDAILFNADGLGYGRFPAMPVEQIMQLEAPLQRASAYINAYENMLAGTELKPLKLLMHLMSFTEQETNELNLRIINGYIGTIFWTFLQPQQRRAVSDSLEATLWRAMTAQTLSSNKKLLFKTYQDIYLSDVAAHRIQSIWEKQQAPDSVKLTEDDYTSLASSLALKTDSATDVLTKQLARISNQDRKARLLFLMPALSADASDRDRFFASLRELSNRRKESWVAAGLAYINHPLRQQSFVKWLPASLDMLQDVQRYGDVFFPQNWLGAIFGNYQSREAWQVVQSFLDTHPNYNPQLKAKILQASDNLHRAVQLQER